MAWKELAILSDNNPSAIGTAASGGTGVEASRYDHVHVIGTGAINASSMFASGVVDSSAIATDAVTSAELAAGAVNTAELANDAVTQAKIAAGAVHPSEMTIDSNLDFNENEATELAVENVTTDPTTTKPGRIVFNTADGALKVYVA